MTRGVGKGPETLFVWQLAGWAGRRLLPAVCAVGTGLLPNSLRSAEDGYSVAANPTQDSGARYRQMLERNPVDGPALDRLWAISAASRTALIEEYRKKAAEGNGAAAVVYGHLLRRDGNLEGALDAYRQAAELLPREAAIALAQADVFGALNRPLDAAAALERAVEMLAEEDPRRETALLRCGELYLTAGQQDAALGIWEQALVQRPTDLALRRRLAELCEANALYPRAILHYLEIARAGPPEHAAGAARDLARLFERDGRVEEAMTALETGLERIAPGNWLAAGMIADLVRLHRAEGSISALRKAWGDRAAKAPRDPAPASRMAELEAALGDAAEQRRWLDRVLELQPADRQSLRMAARLAADARDYAGAAGYARRLLGLQPGDADTVFFLAENLVRDGQSDAAREAVVGLARGLSGDPETMALAVQFLVRQGFWDGAEEVLKDAVGETGTNPEGARALARFYFERDRIADGLAAIAKAVVPDAPVAEQLEALLANVAVLSGARLHEDAARLYEQVLALDPTVERQREYARLLSAAGRGGDAAAALRRGLVDAEPGQRAEMDRDLFALISAMPRSEVQPRSITIPGLGDVPLESRSAAEKRGLHPAVAAELDERAAAVQRAGDDAEALLALGRWQALCGQYDEALTSARRAAANETVRERALRFLVDVGVEAGRYDAALEAVDRLAEVATGGQHSGELQRRRAGILASAGRFDEAVALYRELVARQPRDSGLVAELGQTLEQCEQWASARDLWREAFAQGSPGDREKPLKGLVRALERLGNPGEALDLLDAECLVQGSDGRRQRLFIETVEFARRTGLLQELISRWKGRAEKGEPFAVSSLSTLYKRAGDDRAAYELLRSADPRTATAEVLEAQTGAAEEFGDFHEAVNLLEVAFERFPVTVEQRLRHARLCERAFLDRQAVQAWETTLELAPRNAEIVAEAAAFHGRMGNGAKQLELLERAATLDAHNAAVQHSLGVAYAAGGRVADAINAFLRVLDTTQPLERDAQDYQAPVVPGVATLESLPSILVASRGQISEDELALGRVLRELSRRIPPGNGIGGGGGGGERAIRLDAVRRVSGLLPESAEREAWLARWKSDPYAPESLYAFHFCGANEMARDAFMHWIEIDSGDDARLHWIWSALDRGDARGLGDWIASLPVDKQRRFALVAHAVAVLEGNTDVRAGDLFPESFSRDDTLWQAALLSGRHGDLETAVQLAERAESLPDGPVDPLTMAAWLLALDRVDDGLDLLDATAARSGSGTFDARYTAMRAQYLALDTADATRFAQSRIAEAEARADSDPSGACLVPLLMHSLEGNHDVVAAAAGNYARLTLASGLAAGARSPWGAVLGTAMSFREWGFPKTAVAILQAALTDQARIQLLDDEGRMDAEQARILLASLEIGLADPEDTNAGGPAVQASRSPEWLQTLAAQLEASDAPEAAARIYELAFAQVPDNDALWRSGVLAYAAANRFAEAERFFFETLAQNGNTLPEPAVVRTGEELAEAFENALNPERALGIVERLLKKFPWQTQLRRLSGELLLRLGRTDAAIGRLSDVIQGDPSDWPARLSLSEAIAAEARYVDALVPLGVAGGATSQPPASAPSQAHVAAAMLQTRRGQSGAVVDGRRSLVAQQGYSALIDAALTYAADREENRSRAMAALAQAAPSAGSPLDQALCTLAVADLLAKDREVPDARLMYWLRQAADRANVGLVGPPLVPYLDALRRRALDHESREAFREALTLCYEQEPTCPDVGNAIAALAALQDGTRIERIAKAVGGAVRRRAESVIESIAALRAVGREDLALDLSSILARERRDLPAAQLTHAHTLWLEGGRGEAEAIVSRLRRLRGFDPEITARIGLFLREVGELERAERTLRPVIDADLLRRSPFRGEYARLLLTLQRSADAEGLIRSAGDPDLVAVFTTSTLRQNDLLRVLNELDCDPALAPAVELGVVRILISRGDDEALLSFMENHPQAAAHPAFPFTDVFPLTAGNTRDAGSTGRWVGVLERALAGSQALGIRQPLVDLYLELAQEEPDAERALVFLDRAMRLAPQHPGPVIALAGRLVAAGHREEAEQVTRDFVARSQSSRDVLKVSAAMKTGAVP